MNTTYNKIDISSLTNKNKKEEIEDLSREEKIQKIRQSKEYHRLSDNERQLLEFILKNIPKYTSELGISLHSLEKRTGIEARTLQNLIKNLIAKGKLLKERVGKINFYQCDYWLNQIGYQAI